MEREILEVIQNHQKPFNDAALYFERHTNSDNETIYEYVGVTDVAWDELKHTLEDKFKRFHFDLRCLASTRFEAPASFGLQVRVRWKKLTCVDKYRPRLAVTPTALHVALAFLLLILLIVMWRILRLAFQSPKPRV